MKYFSYALCAAALAFASCTQPTNGNGGGDKDLVLSASKSEITADGTDKVTFTVKYGEEDVTANASIADAATGEVLSGLGSSAAILYYNDTVTYRDGT